MNSLTIPATAVIEPIVVASTKVNLFNLDRAGLVGFFDTLGEKPFRAIQILKWIHQRGVVNFDLMTDLSKALRLRLADKAEIIAPQIISEQTSQDGTRKWLLQMQAGNAIETVFIPEKKRGTLCVSSQVGCALACRFCATGHQGFNRNLNVAEIIAQLWLAEQQLRQDAGLPADSNERMISNVVFMGMGEPLLNFDNLIQVLSLMQDDCAYGLSRRRVTVSTAGVIPALNKLRDLAPVSLALSLHATNDELRDELVPLNKKYPIADLLAACQHYVSGGEQRRHITFEYILISGVNDSIKEAKALVKLIRHLPSKVNLIPFNPFPDSHFKRPQKAQIDAFRQILVDAGLITVTRRTRGSDIAAACGQLAGKVNDRSRRQQRMAAYQKTVGIQSRTI